MNYMVKFKTKDEEGVVDEVFNKILNTVLEQWMKDSKSTMIVVYRIKPSSYKQSTIKIVKIKFHRTEIIDFDKKKTIKN